MLEIVKEKKIVQFIKQNHEQVDEIQKSFVELFNKLGQKYNNQSIQLGFVTAIIGIMLKTTNIPKEEKLKALENLSKKLK